MMFSVVLLVSLIGATQAVTGINKASMFAWGTGVGDTERNVTSQFQFPALLDNGDQLTISNSLPSFKIFGADLGRNSYINYNGHVTFGNKFTKFDPFQVNNTGADIKAIFNVYYSDNDLRRDPGLLFYRISTRPADLDFANTLIRGRGFTTFSSSYCIISTWQNLKYYVRVAADRNNPQYFEQNTYQLVLCTNGNEGHHIYHYNKLEWGRSQDTSTNFATVGWHVKQATDGLKYWIAPNSGTQFVQSMATSSDVGVAGRWMRSQAVVGPCVGFANGVYAVNCTHYRFCCNQRAEKVASCPENTSYHSTLKKCVMNDVFPCGATNFCAGKANGHYANTVTGREDDFIRCRSGLTRLLLCPTGITFGTSARCN